MRGAIAWARLGGFIWQGTKKGGVRECPMCGGNDSLMHILTVCENFKNEREVILQNWGKIQIWEMGHIFKIKNLNHQKVLGIFLLKVRGKRSKTLKEN